MVNKTLKYVVQAPGNKLKEIDAYVQQLRQEFLQELPDEPLQINDNDFKKMMWAITGSEDKILLLKEKFDQKAKELNIPERDLHIPSEFCQCRACNKSIKKY